MCYWLCNVYNIFGKTWWIKNPNTFFITHVSFSAQLSFSLNPWRVRLWETWRILLCSFRHFFFLESESIPYTNVIINLTHNKLPDFSSISCIIFKNQSYYCCCSSCVMGPFCIIYSENLNACLVFMMNVDFPKIDCRNWGLKCEHRLVQCIQ